MYNNYKEQAYSMPYGTLQTFQSCYNIVSIPLNKVYLGSAKNELSHKDNLPY